MSSHYVSDKLAAKEWQREKIVVSTGDVCASEKDKKWQVARETILPVFAKNIYLPARKSASKREKIMIFPLFHS